MSLFEKIILKDVQNFQNLTAEEKERDLILFKHKYIAIWLSGLFMNSMVPWVIALIVCIIDLVICFTCNVAIVSIAFFTTLPIVAFISTLAIFIMYKSIFKKKTEKEIRDLLYEKFQNLWLLNQEVISFKDWKIIKKRNKVFYYRARSEESNNKCYFTSYAIANTLENPDIKILWISVQTTSSEYKCGHSVIVKKEKIYDSNFRRTYNREEYLKAFRAEIFKEYSIEEYMNKSNLKKEQFDFLDWEEFGKWCEEKNVVRSN